MRDQDAGWVTHRSDQDPSQLLEHPAVVLRVVEGRAVVIHGTSTERNEPHVRVDPRSTDGIALKLTNPTFFYRRSVLIVRTAQQFRFVVRCPPDLFLKLRRLAGL